MPPDTFIERPDFQRNRWGQPLVVPASGGKPVAYKRASSYGSPIENRSGLEKWMKTRVAHGAVLRPDLVTKAAAAVHDPRRLGTCAEELFEAGGGGSAANIGTAIHDVLARLDAGHIAFDDIPEEFAPYARHWLDALETHGFEVVPHLVECHLVCDGFEVAGSADNILRRKSDGALVIADRKTGKLISERPISYAVQMYLYAHSDLYDVRTHERTPIEIDRSVAYLFHIPASGEGCTIYPVDLQGSTRVAAETARTIHELRRTFAKVVPLPAPDSTEQPPAPGTASAERLGWVKGRIATVLAHSEQARAQLLSRWPESVPGFKTGHRHTDEEINAIIGALTRVEAENDIPFGPTDPDAGRIEEDDVALIKATFPDAVEVDETEEVDPADIDRLRDILDALPDSAKAFVSAVTHEAKDARRPLSVTQSPTRRRYEIAQALIWVAMFEDPDVARALVALVEPEARTAATLGRLFGGLRIEQAVALQKIAHALDTSVLTLAFATDGTPEIRGDVQAVLAA